MSKYITAFDAEITQILRDTVVSSESHEGEEFNSHIDLDILPEMLEAIKLAVDTHIIGKNENEIITHGRSDEPAEHRNDVRDQLRKNLRGSTEDNDNIR